VYVNATPSPLPITESFLTTETVQNLPIHRQDQKAALALVNTRPDSLRPASSSSTDTDDPDLKRAKDLLELHADVKLAHADGTDPELIEARRAVEKVLRDL
jgi:hypothetical protein